MNLLKNFRIYDLVVIALMAALGLAVKSIVTPLTHMISGPLNMPGGALAGGFYMFWIVLAGALVGKRGAATLTALVQALMVIVIGSVGSHGIMSIVTYTMPGLMVDLVFLVARRQIKTNMDFFVGGMVANMTGTFLTGMVFFRLPLVTMVMILASGMLSGGLGGLIAYATYKGVKQMELMGHDEETKAVKPKKSYKGVILLVAILGVVGLVYVFGGFDNQDKTPVDEVDSEGTVMEVDSSLSLVNASPLLISGDVMNGGYLETYEGQLTFRIVDDAMRIETTVLLYTLGLRSDHNKVYLIGQDGFMVGLNGLTLQDTYIAYNHDSGWMFISDKHPVNSGIKQMVELVVVSEDGLEDFNIIAEGSNHFYSFGDMRLMMTDLVQVTDGISKLGDIEIDVMKIKSVVPVRDLVSEDVPVMIATVNGALIYEYGNPGYLEFSQGNIRYHTEDMLTTYQNVIGIMENPPSASIKDHYQDVQHYLDRGIRVLSIYVDGFSYRQYEALLNDEGADYMDSLSHVVPATVGYMPVTNVGFATMLTGVDPSVHGIHDRSFRQPAVATIFDYCNDQGISNGLIEGNAQILALNTDTTLNIDANENGTIDDEIHESALMNLHQYDYMMVHYHSVDDFGHDNGEMSDDTMSQLKMIDGYIEELVSQWDGKVIILADHGMHSTQEGGSHGAFRVEDFVVPYVILDGGLYEQE